MNTRVPSVPLITIDPYFSLWSPADRLYDSNTVHWTGQTKRVRGTVQIDGADYRFMGLGKEIPLEQKGLEITATSSVYVFEGASTTPSQEISFGSGNVGIEKTPKTKSSIRTIPIPSLLLPYLKKQCANKTPGDILPEFPTKF